MALDRDTASADALLTDLYLDALLAGVVLDRAARDAATDGQPGGGIDAALTEAAERLRHDLVRVHPSFRFEERLAVRLAEAAVGLRVPLAVGAEGRVVPFPIGPVPDEDSNLLDVDPTARRDRSRPILIGGALTSAAISIAGAAFVAWRFGRPGRATTPMARAARAVRDARHAATATIPTIDPASIRRRLD
ncbi:MAG: hypothetical protein QOF49_562 [Chloroflexota bacterium]|nr:hypothetical protein [Chloroflexota bacterium]